MLTVDFERLNIREGDIVLDAGCGFGRHSMEFMNRGADIFSMDIDFESLKKTKYALALLKKESDKSKSRYMAHVGDALRLPFKDNTFKSIICSEVMEHVDNDFLACSELTRVLKKNGRIAITVPTFFSEAIYDVLTYEYFSTPGGHVRKYLPRRLAQIMEKNGLEIYSIGFKHSFHTIWWTIRCIVGLHRENHPLTRAYHFFLNLSLKAPFLRKTESFFDNFFPKSLVLYAWKK